MDSQTLAAWYCLIFSVSVLAGLEMGRAFSFWKW